MGQPFTSEDGDTVEIAVTLASQPTAAVTVRAVSSNEAEGQVSGILRFNRHNWNVPQIITVTGVDDGLDDGDVAYEVMLYAGRGAQRRRTELVEILELVNRDDDVTEFQGLGDLPGGDIASYASDVSALGDVVVGWSRGPDGDEAIRWTSDGGLEGLGGPESQAHAVSPDGTLLAGSIAEGTHEGGRAAVLWQDDQPYEILLGPTYGGGIPVMWIVDGEAVLNDGRVFGTCIQTFAYGEPIACLYRGPGDAAFVPGSKVFVADDEGDYAGTTISERHAPRLSHAMYNGVPLPYPTDAACLVSTGGCFAEARDFSADDSVIVGTATLPAPNEPPGGAFYETAFVYTEAEGSVRLADLTGGAEAAGAFAISADGTVIAGYGTDESGKQATIWLQGAPYLLEEVFEAAGGDLPEGWSLHEVTAMSLDGLTLVGNATNPDGYPEGFRLVLPTAADDLMLVTASE